MNRRALLVFCGALAFGSAGCPSKEQPAASTAPARAASREVPPPSASAATVRSEGAPSAASAVSAPPRSYGPERLVRPKPIAARSLGHTSLVFRVHLEDGTDVLFKPRFRKGPERYRGEIAASRLGDALGIASLLPKAAPMDVSPTTFRALLSGPSAEAYDAQALVNSTPAGQVLHGASIGWILDLTFVPIEKKALREQLFSSVNAHAVVANSLPMKPAEFSTMLAFDWLTGNFDRWSGGNLGHDGASGNALFIDNDGAFLDPMPKGPLSQQWTHLERCDRFSKSFINALQQLGNLEQVLGQDGQSAPLLSTAVVAGVRERRTKLLELIDAKEKNLGAAVVYAFE